MLNRLFTSAAAWTGLALASGFYWRELTKFNDFPRSETMLATAHTHALALGTLVLLAVLALAKVFGLAELCEASHNSSDVKSLVM